MPIRLLKKLIPILKLSRNLLHDRFIAEVNEDIDALNQQITAYNSKANPNKKLKILKKLYQQWNVVGNKYNTEFITVFSAYQEQIHVQLYKDIKTAFNECGRSSLFNMYSTLISEKTPRAFSEFLMNLSPEKVSSMLSILSAGVRWDRTAFENLYRRGEPGYEDFQRLLRTHNIIFLGGINSKNFEVNSLTPENQIKFVLKVDNRLGMPRSVEAHLREGGLESTFTTVYAERQATYKPIGTETFTTSTLLLTEFCKGKDLAAHAQLKSNPQERIASAINIYSQMAMILLKIKDKDCFFPDPKNTNWLFDEKGIVRIADTKSFVYAKASAGLKFWRTRFDYGDLLKDWCGLLGTAHMNPPEFSVTHLSSHKISVDKCHAYMLGKNLYQYLSRCDDDYLINKHNGSTYDFSSSAFHGEQGRMLKDLIIRLIKPNPKDRLRLRDITSTLTNMYIKLSSNQCTLLLNEVEALGWGSDDTPMCDYLHRMRSVIHETTRHEDFIALEGELNNLLIGLRAIPIRKYIKDIEEWGEDKTEGAQLIVAGILAEVKRISIDERGRYEQPTSTINRLAKQLKDRLDAHRAQVRRCVSILRDLSLQFEQDPLISEFCLIKRTEMNTLVDLNVFTSTLDTTLSSLKTVTADFKVTLLRIRSMVATVSGVDNSLLTAALNEANEMFYAIPINKRYAQSREIIGLNSRLVLIEKRVVCYKLLQQIEPNTMLGYWNNVGREQNSLFVASFCQEVQRMINSTDDLTNITKLLDSTITKLKTVSLDISARLSRLEVMLASFSQTERLSIQEALNQVRKTFYTTPIDRRFEESAEVASLKNRLVFVEKQASSYELLRQIESHAIRDFDPLMLTFITNQRCNIQSKTTADEQEKIKQELLVVLANIEDPMGEINGFINRFHTKATARFSVRMSEKEHLIEDAIRQIPPEKRSNAWLRTSTSPEAVCVREALAFHRHLGRQRLYRGSDGNLDESKAAESYKKLFGIETIPVADFSFYFRVRCLARLSAMSYPALVVVFLLSPILAPLTIVAATGLYVYGLFSKAAPKSDAIELHGVPMPANV